MTDTPPKLSIKASNELWDWLNQQGQEIQAAFKLGNCTIIPTGKHIHRFEYDARRFLWWCIDCNGCLVEGDMQKFMDKHRDKAATDNFSGSMDKMIDMKTGYLPDA